MSAFVRIALPVLAAAGIANAACSASATSTIENGGDASAIASCSTFSGSVAVATGMADDINLDKLEVLDGDFHVESNSDIQRISAPSLTTISGAFFLNDVSQLASLDFPVLDEVDEMTLQGLANLRELGFTAGVSKCKTLHIENTQLQNLNGLNFNETDSVNIANNGAISQIGMNVTNITILAISDNNAQVNVSFPNLEQATNVTCVACGSIDLNSLSELGSGLIIRDGELESVNCPKLEKIGGALNLDRNKNLVNVSFPALTDVGKDMRIANNTELKNVTGLPKLKNVGAAFDMAGNFTDVETPSLDFVKGVFNLQSTADLGDSCNFYDDLKSKSKVPKNKYVCEGKLKEAGTAGTKPSGGSSDDKGAAASVNVQFVSLGLAGLAAVLLV